MKKTTTAATKKTTTQTAAEAKKETTAKKTTTVKAAEPKKTTVKKTTAKASGPKKATVKKTTAVKKETAPKKTTKAKTTYKPVKMNIQVQYNYHDVSLTEIEDMVVNHLVDAGYKKTSILTLDIYYKAETSEVFYIAKTIRKLSKTKNLYIFNKWLPFLLEGEFFNDSPPLLKKEAIKLLFYMSSLPINSASNNIFTIIR